MASCCSDRLNKWKKRCPTAVNQLRNVCRHKHGYFRHYKVNTWTYTFFSFSWNTKKKSVRLIETWTLLFKNRSLVIETLTLCHPKNSWLTNKDITWNLRTAYRNLFNNGHFAYNYKWKCQNNIVSMKSNHLICRMQHHILIETVKRYMTQIENSLTAPCWHHVGRESRRKALWINMAMLCAKRPQSQNRRLSPGLAKKKWSFTDWQYKNLKILTWKN